jgi:uncharacterized protein (TIGR03437 family)
VLGSWAQVKGSNLSSVARVWTTSDFVGLGNGLPTTLSGTSVTVNGAPAAVYYASPGQVTFQVPSGVSGTVSVQVLRNGVGSNVVTGTAITSAPGIFPVVLYGINYAAGVSLDGKIVGDPDMGSAFREAVPGDVVQLFATGLAPSPAGTLVGVQNVDAVTVTVGSITFPAEAAALVVPGEFQVNFTVPQEFASAPEGIYPITISINGVSSPITINSTPPAQLVLPIHH